MTPRPLRKRGNLSRTDTEMQHGRLSISAMAVRTTFKMFAVMQSAHTPKQEIQMIEIFETLGEGGILAVVVFSVMAITVISAIL